MRKKTAPRLVAALCALLVLLTACRNPLDLLEPTSTYQVPRGYYGYTEQDEEDYFDERSQYGAYGGRNLVNYNEMEYYRPDVDAYKQQLADIVAAVPDLPSFEDLQELDWDTGMIWLEFNTMFTLAMLGSYQDYDSSYWEAEYEYLVDASVELETYSNDFNRAIMESPFAEQYHEWAGDYYWERMRNNLLLSSPEVEAYKQERAALGVQYTSALNNLTFEWQGATLTEDDIEDIYDEYGYDVYIEALAAYYSQNIEPFVDIYIRMIELDKLTAETLGFASVADMYYLSYERDYTPQDAESLCTNVRELFADLTPYILSVYTVEVEYDDLISAVPGILRSVDMELADAWDDMQYYDLYDFEARDGKQSGIGFTTYITGYDAPFSYVYWDGTINTASTVIHEFGHFYDYWLHFDEATSNNLDIAECYSQGLEVLAQRYYSQFTEYPDYAVMYNLAGLMQAISYQALLEEFQLRVYELEELSVETISGLYTTLMEDYGYGLYSITDESGLAHSWFEITHLFNYPFYTISYTTSAVVALQIYKESLRDWEGAADTYLAMMHADQLQPFTRLVESVGLKNPTDRATLEEINDIYRDLFEVPASGDWAA